MNQAGVFLGFATFRNGTYGSILLIGDKRIVVAKETMDFIHDLFPLKTAPSANSEYAWLHRLLKRYKSPKKYLLTEDFEDVQGNEIAALDPLQEADEVLTRSSKPVVVTRSYSSSADSEDSDPMEFDNEVLEALAHLDHAPTPPTIVKISSILP